MFWWIWVSILVNWAGAFTRPVLALSLTAGHGYPVSYAGFVIALIGLGGLLGTVAGGVLADRLGRRPTLVLAHLITAVAMVALGTAGGHWQIEVAAFAVGAGSTAARPAMNAALADVVPQAHRQRAFSLNYWAVNVGVAASSALAGVMVTYGYTLVFVADAAATALCALIVLLKVPETRPAAAPRAHREARTRLRLDRRFVVFLLATLAIASVYEQSATTLPIVMVGAGLGAWTFGLVQSLNGLLIALLQIPLTRWGRRHSRRAILVGSALLIGWGFGLNAFAGGLPGYAVVALVWTVGEILQMPTGSAVAADRAPGSLRGRYAALYTGAWAAAALLGPLGGGWLLDSGGPASVWLACAVLGALAAAGFAFATGTKTPARGWRLSRAEPGDTPQPATKTGGGTALERTAP
ncbi:MULTISPECIES: MFS transporter [Amycolatopsis]|uniref:MFS transporter n=1 Tax=Amycolatopsis bullii TaxID=941987 RepID=A0ABQ3K694_9PSEU|nr:MFS transporter [Amycolatopsis bullii]GHG01729.1 MFS transporter [Amycolatopsis bullii]